MCHWLFSTLQEPGTSCKPLLINIITKLIKNSVNSSQISHWCHHSITGWSERLLSADSAGLIQNSNKYKAVSSTSKHIAYLGTQPCDSGFRCITCSQSYWQKHIHIPPRPEYKWKSKSRSHLKFQNHWSKVFNEINDYKQMKK